MLAVVLVAQHWYAETAGFWDVSAVLVRITASQDASAALMRRKCRRAHTNDSTFPKKMHFSAQACSAADVCRAVWPELSDSLHTGHPAAAGW